MPDNILKQLFEKCKYLKVNQVAVLANMHPSLLSQYVNGIKKPSKKQIQKIQEAVQGKGRELMNVKLRA